MPGIFAITVPIFAIIAVGFAVVRFGFFAKSDMRVLGRFVINLALPALLFKALSERSFAEIVNGGYLLAYALGSLAVLGAAIAVARFVQDKSLQVSAIHGMGVSLSNSGFIGYPIVLQLLGPAAAVALALTMMVENLVVLPLALALAAGGSQGGGSLPRVLVTTFGRLLKNPLILAILAGFAFALLGAHPPQPIARAIDMLAMASGAVALLVIGGTLVGLELKGMGRDVAQIVVGKLVLHPLAVFAMLLLLPPIDPQLRLAAITFASMPMLSIYPILAQKYGQEGLCAAALLAATVTAFFSISAVLWMMGGAAG
jgi:malonate transporter and related proteins